MLFTFPMHGTHDMSGGFPACSAGGHAWYTPTILPVSCMTKTDNIHEQWLLANIPTYIDFKICISNPFLEV